MRQTGGSGNRRLSRRTALVLGVGLLAGCRTAPGGAGGVVTAAGVDPVAAAADTLLDGVRACRPATQLAQGPYWFDVDRLRGDVREDRRGAALRLALQVVDGAGCGRAPVPGAVVEIWHCDAAGRYSGFEGRNPLGAELPAADPTGDPMGYSTRTSDGSYSAGDAEAEPSDDSTYLRGAQVTGADGVARFRTIYPGWSTGRAPHVHVKVYRRRHTVLCTQLFFDDTTSDAVYRAAPYRPGAPRNRSDLFFRESLLLPVRRLGDAYLGAHVLGVDLLDVPPGAAGTLGG